MRVLQVATFNIAGVPGLLVKGLRDKGVETELIVNLSHPFGFPYETVIEGGGTKFLRHTVTLSRGYDIVHMHGLLYRFCADVFALKLFWRKLLLHFHGTELRQGHDVFSVKLAQSISNKVLVSTPDLLVYCSDAEWLPNPIDPVFKAVNNPERRGRALYFRKQYEPEKEKMVKEKCANMGLKLTVPNSSIPYSEMPRFLNQFEVFFDRFSIHSLSKTALEALACGCRVIGWNGPVSKPEEVVKHHSLEAVSEKLIQHYAQISEK